MKGIILCGGFGLRLRPCTEVTNKHLLPVYDKPMIYYPIETLQGLGIYDIGLVLGGESVGDFVRLLGDGNAFGVKFTYFYQRKAGGIAEAVALCEDFVGKERFAVILGDNLFLGGNLKEIKLNMEKCNADVGLVLVEVSRPEYYGVPRFEDNRLIEVIEKPKIPPSKYAIAGLYIYTPNVFDIIKKLKPSGRGELEISDVQNEFIRNRKTIYWEIFTGKWFDCGNSFDDLLTASNEVQKWKRKEGMQ